MKEQIVLKKVKQKEIDTSINDILSRIRYMEPFIYKLGNAYYYLGANICHECNDEEVARYDRYLDALKALDVCNYHIERKDSKNLATVVRDIMDVPNSAEPETCDSKWRFKMATKMESLNSQELQDVRRQLMDLDRAFKYIAGSYCVDKPCKQMYL